MVLLITQLAITVANNEVHICRQKQLASQRAPQKTCQQVQSRTTGKTM